MALVTPAALMAPRGLLTMDLFAKKRSTWVVQRIAGWIAQAKAERTGLTSDALNTAVSAFVYWRAYFEAWQEAVTKPSSVSVAEKGSSAFSQKQIDDLKVEADKWENAWVASLGAGEEDEFGGASGSVKARVVWD